MSRKRQICLWNLDQAALIILEKSGITYFNQTAGVFCRHSEAERILAPITNDPPLDNLHFGSLNYKLQQLTLNKQILKETDADAIDKLLQKNFGGDAIFVDRERLNESCEAWIHVKIDGQTKGDLQDFAGYMAILTYPNSD